MSVNRLDIPDNLGHISPMAETPDLPKFLPPRWLRPSAVQTTLAGLKLRRRGPNPMRDAGEEVILNVTEEDGSPVRLMGKMSRQVDGEAKGLVILLHGWEGSENSTYVLCAGRSLYAKGYDVFRLNYRDHGDTHHLNEGLFYAPLFNEVFEAVSQIAAMCADQPTYVMGFSMGGNFVLRIARELTKRPIPNLRHLIAISPVIDPFVASPMIDERPIIRRYFHRKWTTSMAKKQALYPHLYNFDDIIKLKNVMDISRRMIAEHSHFPDEQSFFDGYKIFQDDLADVLTPVTIITAKDDPIIPTHDLDTINTSAAVNIIAHDHGGHNGFFQSVMGPTWYDDHFEAIIAR